MKHYALAILNSYFEIIFLRNYWHGILLLGATLLNPNLAMAGIIAVISAYIFARAIHLNKDFLDSGFYTYNPLLVGFAIGYLFKITPLTIFYLVTAGISTFILTMFLNHVLSYYLKLPILSLPFVIITSVMYLAASKYSNLYVQGLYIHHFDTVDSYFPFWLAGFCKSLGAIFFLPDALAGFAIAVVILISSRILFLMAVTGYYSGTLMSAVLLGSYQQAFANINHFNYSLIAMAIGGIFLIPSLKSYCFAIICVWMSIPILDSVEIFWSFYAIPGFTLPFVVITLSFIYVLGLVNYPQLTRIFKSTPEETLDDYLTNQRRYRGSERTLTLPFAGKWTVWQGFDGHWTHQGNWRHAYDFIITDDDGNSHRNQGNELTNYYAYRKPVLSPVRGRVSEVISHLPDNPIGQVDKTNNWGNLIIIYDERGFFVELSHFATDSIKVKPGDWVERGALLGLCGNSGYSPQPHLHIQAQITAAIGSLTIPFSFVHYVRDNKYVSNELPGEKDAVEAIIPEKSMQLKTRFNLDDRFQYDVWRNGQKVDTLTIVVNMTPDGTFYFDAGKARLYFGEHEGTFFFYRLDGQNEYLQALFLAIPRLPLYYADGLSWRDHVPFSAVSAGLMKSIVQFMNSFYHGLIETTADLQWRSPVLVEGKIRSSLLRIEKHTRVELDDYHGFKSIKIGQLELKRVENETVRP